MLSVQLFAEVESLRSRVKDKERQVDEMRRSSLAAYRNWLWEIHYKKAGVIQLKYQGFTLSACLYFIHSHPLQEMSERSNPCIVLSWHFEEFIHFS